MTRRYQKDEMAEILKEPVDVQDTDLEGLLAKSKEILRRDIQNLLAMSIKGKLKAQDARTLTEYTTLLNKLVNEERKRLEGMSPEELEALGSKGKSDSDPEGIS